MHIAYQPCLRWTGFLFLDQGKIVEEGTHQALMAQQACMQRYGTAKVGGFLLDEEMSVTPKQ